MWSSILGALLMAWDFLKKIGPLLSGGPAPPLGEESLARPASTSAE